MLSIIVITLLFNVSKRYQYASGPSIYADTEPVHGRALMKERLQGAWHRAGLKIKYSQEQAKDIYDQGVKTDKFEEGDKVLIEDLATKKGITPKLERHFKGPYIVIKVF